MPLPLRSLTLRVTTGRPSAGMFTPVMTALGFASACSAAVISEKSTTASLTVMPAGPQVMVRVPLPLSVTVQLVPGAPGAPATVPEVPSVQVMVVVPSLLQQRRHHHHHLHR